jgi:eukaryotic-like serine/threonine-protein kinase
MTEQNLATYDGFELRPWKRRTINVRLAHEFVQLPVDSDQSTVYCGFWRRFGAHLVDSCLVASVGSALCVAWSMTVNSTIGTENLALLAGYFGFLVCFCGAFIPGLGALFALSGVFWLCHFSQGALALPLLAWMIAPFAFDLLYRAICESSPVRATLGKRLARIYVADLKGNGLTFGHALKRNAAKSILIPAFILGPISTLWTRRKQAHHDAFSETVVIKNAGHLNPPKLLR